MFDIAYFALILKDIVIPILTIIVTALVTIVGWRRGVFNFSSAMLPESLPSVRKATQQVTAGGEIEKHFDIEKFDQYHEQSLSQSRISFWFSLSFAAIGFVIIASSAFANDSDSAYLGVISGTVIDAVAALFFYQANKARQLMSEFFDKLRADRNQQEALRLCASIDDNLMRNSLKLTLALYFSGFKNSDALAKEIIAVTRTNVRDEARPPVEPTEDGASAAMT